MELKERAAAILAESIATKTAIDSKQIESIAEIARVIGRALEKGNSVYTMGNGGSATDAQHFAGELMGRFRSDRRGLRVVALTADSAVITSLGNDFGFQSVFAKQIEALARPGDVAIGISTSGNSANIVGALAIAREMGAFAVALTGKAGGRLKGLCDLVFYAPSQDTARIQECHSTVIHIICELVEDIVS